MISHCHAYCLYDAQGLAVETSSDFEYLRGRRDLLNTSQPGHRIVWER